MALLYDLATADLYLSNYITPIQKSPIVCKFYIAALSFIVVCKKTVNAPLIT